MTADHKMLFDRNRFYQFEECVALGLWLMIHCLFGDGPNFDDLPVPRAYRKSSIETDVWTEKTDVEGPFHMKQSDFRVCVSSNLMEYIFCSNILFNKSFLWTIRFWKYFNGRDIEHSRNLQIFLKFVIK